MPADGRTDLTAELRAMDDDPPPAALLAAARAAFSWRTLDTDLCRPSYDSLLDEGLTAVRGEQSSRLLRFATADVALDVEVTADGDGRTLVGQVTPAEPSDLTVRHGGADEMSVSTDTLGRFVVEGLRGGPLSMRCVVPSQNSSLFTDWVLV
ncbi:MAG: hypothetical protein QOJ79_1338 [Actinomycetota bacterium]|jgi:hypothetical protein|nr:hypothetical protein [Actinomycetota bacterium]